MFDEESQNPAFIVMQHHQHQQALQEMQITEIRNAMDRFLDDLTPEQCLNLSRMIQIFTNNPHYLHVVTGQLSILMRVVHGVCSSCGDAKHSTVEHLTAQQPVPDPKDSIDFSWLASMSPVEQIRKLNLEENSAQEGMFTCRNCGTHYLTLFDRAVKGKYCTGCINRAIEQFEVPDNELIQADLMIRYEMAESFTTEDAVFCIKCDTEFPSMKHRVDQGELCPVCKIHPGVSQNERPSETL